jgi:phosphopantetheinyl transferase
LRDDQKSPLGPLGTAEVRILTLDSGDSALVREASRNVIASLIGVGCDAVDIYTAPQGKPLLRNDAKLHFSISHSRDIAMMAITRVAPVGVDIEQIRAVPNAEAILRRFFTHEDATGILTAHNRDRRFMEAWTRAEARVKVRGASVWESSIPDPRTTIRKLRAPSGFVAAVAVASAAWKISQYNISTADLVAK